MHARRLPEGCQNDAWGSETQPTLCGWVGSKLAHSVRQRIRRGPKLTGEKLTSTRSI
jgi:hypothetical protein